MARIKLELPETFPFSTERTVRITDLKDGGHLGNADLCLKFGAFGSLMDA
jgi:hypothetical protein